MKPCPRITWRPHRDSTCRAYMEGQLVGVVFRDTTVDWNNHKTSVNPWWSIAVVTETDWALKRKRFYRRCEAKRCVERAVSRQWYEEQAE